MATSPTLPTPEGMTWHQIRRMKITDGEWREESEYVYYTCKQPAFVNPYNNNIWGCKQCGFTTTSVSVHFQPKDETAA